MTCMTGMQTFLPFHITSENSYLYIDICMRATSTTVAGKKLINAIGLFITRVRVTIITCVADKHDTARTDKAAVNKGALPVSPISAIKNGEINNTVPANEKNNTFSGRRCSCGYRVRIAVCRCAATVFCDVSPSFPSDRKKL